MASSSSSSSSSSSKKQEIRRDEVFNKWVIYSPARARRPSDFKSHGQTSNSTSSSSSCPFCKGHEHECAPEIFRDPPDSGPDWRIRVIQNLFPALDRTIMEPKTSTNSDVDGDVDLGNCCEVIQGFGFHDVVIETPEHGVNLSDLSAEEVGRVLLAYKKRILQLAEVESIEYVQVFKNHGASAGASLSHSHSQIMGIPFVPATVATRLASMEKIFSASGKCHLCHCHNQDNLIPESLHYVSFVPIAASYPFEIWIVPREHSCRFEDINPEKANDLGHMLKLMLLKLSHQLNNPPFNYVLHSSPFRIKSNSLPYMHWFIQIIPQLVGIAGFEIGTGCYINPIFPEDAANVLKYVVIPM